MQIAIPIYDGVTALEHDRDRGYTEIAQILGRSTLSLTLPGAART